MNPPEPPKDYAPDDYDPTGYYARKAAHRAEMLPFVAACIVGTVVIVIVATIIQVMQ